MKLGMKYLSEIYWRLSWDVCILDQNNFEFLVVLSLCQLTYFLTEIRILQGYLQFQMRYISEICWTHSQDISLQFQNHFDFFVCLSVCQLAYFLTEIRIIQGYLQFQMRYISEFFWRHSQDISEQFSDYFDFFVFLSVCQLAQFLSEIRILQGYLQFQMRYISEIFWRLSQNICVLDPNNSEFFVCLSVCQLGYFLTDLG